MINLFWDYFLECYYWLLDIHNSEHPTSYESDPDRRLEYSLRTAWTLNLYFIIYALPVITGLFTFLFMLSLGIDKQNYRTIVDVKDRQRFYPFIVKALRYPRKAKERFLYNMDALKAQKSIQVRHRTRRLRRTERWLWRPTLDVERLKFMTTKPNKTPQEKDWVDDEWANYYRSVDVRDHIYGRYLIRRRKFIEELEKQIKQRDDLKLKQYEDIIHDDKKTITHKQFCSKLLAYKEEKWKIEKQYISWRNLLPTHDEAVIWKLIPLLSIANADVRFYGRRVVSFIHRRIDDYEDYYYIYWEYSTYIGNKFFPNLRRKLRYFIKKHTFGVWIRSHIKLKKYLYESQTIKRIKRFYFINILYPIEKKILNTKKIIFIIRFKFNERINAFQTYIKNNPNKLHVKAFKYTKDTISKSWYMHILRKYVFSPYKIIKQNIKWYVSTRVWNKKTWEQRWFEGVKASVSETQERFALHLRFDAFIRKLGWFKKLLPVNTLRRWYVYCNSPMKRSEEEENKILLNERMRERMIHQFLTDTDVTEITYKSGKKKYRVGAGIQNMRRWIEVNKYLSKNAEATYKRLKIKQKKLEHKKKLRRQQARVSDAAREQRKKRPGGDDEGTWWF